MDSALLLLIIIKCTLFAIRKLSQLKASKLAVHVVGRNSAIRSAVHENPILEPNMEWIGRPVAEIWLFEIFEMRGRSPVAGRSVVNIYLLLLISYTPLRYVGNVAHEE